MGVSKNTNQLTTRRIRNAKLSDIGNYKIKAKNVESSASLKVKGNLKNKKINLKKFLKMLLFFFRGTT